MGYSSGSKKQRGEFSNAEILGQVFEWEDIDGISNSSSTSSGEGASSSSQVYLTALISSPILNIDTIALAFYNKGKKLLDSIINEEDKEGGTLVKAINNLEKAHELMPTNAFYTKSLAQAYYEFADTELREESEWKKVAEYMEKAHKLVPTNLDYIQELVDVCFIYANELIEIDAFGQEAPEAIEYLTKANALIPFAGRTEETYNSLLASAHYKCGEAMKELGSENFDGDSASWSQMITHFTKAHELEPTNSTYFADLAETQSDATQVLYNTYLKQLIQVEEVLFFPSGLLPLIASYSASPEDDPYLIGFNSELSEE